MMLEITAQVECFQLNMRYKQTVHSRQNLLDHNLKLDGCTVTSSTVKNLGVILDSNLTFENHISHVTKTAFFHLKHCQATEHVKCF